MIDYMSAAQTAAKWRLSKHRTNIRLAEGRVTGTITINGSSIIPADTRIKRGEYIGFKAKYEKNNPEGGESK